VGAGVPATREQGMHSERHFGASVQLEAGIRALAECLGHADPGFTLRTCTHLQAADAGRGEVAR
jgi:hypothetical protein